MARLEAAMAWFFSSLGVVLLGCSILVVPADAFADTGSPDCATQCSTDLDPTTCMNTCCTNLCNGDQTCYSNCMAQLGGCPGDSCENGSNCFVQWSSQGSCDNAKTYCNNGGNNCDKCYCRKIRGYPQCGCRN